jgi:hypothetical protein
MIDHIIWDTYIFILRSIINLRCAYLRNDYFMIQIFYIYTFLLIYVLFHVLMKCNKSYSSIFY